MSRTRWLGGVLLAAALSAGGCSSGPPKKPADEPRPAHLVDLERLMPSDVDLVVRADLARARSQGVLEELLVWLRAAQLSAVMLEAIAPCLETASSATLGLRLGPNGLDGDILLRLQLPAADKRGTPCDAQDWRSTGTTGGVEVFEPSVPQRRRDAPAMMLRNAAGTVVIATPGQIDATLRLVRDGPDGETLEPPSDAMVGLVARVDEAQLPAAWRQKAPTLTAILRGLDRLVVRLDVGERVTLRATLAYVERRDVDDAASKLRDFREALVSSERESWKRTAQAAHAEKAGDVIRVDLTLPRER